MRLIWRGSPREPWNNASAAGGSNNGNSQLASAFSASASRIGSDRERHGHRAGGAVLSYRDDPARAAAQDAVRFHQRGAVVLGGHGRIVWCGPAAELPDRFRALAADDYGAALVLEGFIDAHIHFPQCRMLAARSKDLLEWLQRFSFPEECRYRSRTHACAAAEVFLDRLLQHGTTAAVVFSTVHRGGTEALFAAAEARRMAIVTGKTMMDRVGLIRSRHG